MIQSQYVTRRLSTVTFLFALTFLVTDASSARADVVVDTQSTLPTTSYSFTGVANDLASAEERNVMGHLRSLRAGSSLTPARTVQRAPIVKPLQETDDTLLDLRTGKKVEKPAGKYGTMNYYRAYSPAIYRDKNETLPPSDPTLVEKGYDKVMGWATTGAGAPNENHRESDEPRVRLVPNMADRTAAKVLDTSGSLAGQNQVWATATGGMPRRVLTGSYESKPVSQLYRGQPLSKVSGPSEPLTIVTPSNTPPVILSAPAPTASPSLGAPTPLTASARVADPVIDVQPGPNVSASAPVITSPGDATNAIKPAVKKPFRYQKIDQSEGLTTPILGEPDGNETSLSIKQTGAMAMIDTDQTNVKRYVGARKATDTGSLLWVDDTHADTAKTPEPPLLAQVPTYGKQAVPLPDQGAVNADRRWGFFVTGMTGFGSDDHQNNSANAKTNKAGFTAGGDYRVSDDTYLGAALTYIRSSFTTGNYGDLQANSMAVSLYGTTRYLEKAYVDGYASIGYMDLDSERTIISGTTHTGAKGDPDGYQLAAKVETGYDFEQQKTTYGPFAGFRLAYADFDDLTEEGASAYNLNVRGFNNLSAIASLGVGASHKIETAGANFLPSLRMGYNHEFGDDTSAIKAEFVSSGVTSNTSSSKKSRDWINVTPSVTAALPNDWMLVAQYEHDFFREDANENVFNLTANYKW